MCVIFSNQIICIKMKEKTYFRLPSVHTLILLSTSGLLSFSFILWFFHQRQIYSSPTNKSSHIHSWALFWLIGVKWLDLTSPVYWLDSVSQIQQLSLVAVLFSSHTHWIPPSVSISQNENRTREPRQQSVELHFFFFKYCENNCSPSVFEKSRTRFFPLRFK